MQWECNLANVHMAHPDALGYLSDFTNDAGLPWIEMICGLATRDAGDLSDRDIDVLFALFVGKASYLRPAGLPSRPAAGAAAVPADFLETLAAFSNFKLIGDALRLDFKKRITLVFGANGSGKSSLCETLRLLASPEPPVRPLQNVRSGDKNAPSFKFKFRSDGGEVTWSPAVGYGTKQSTVKHFDAAVANRNIKVAINPSRLIELAPFKLYVFERTMNLTNRFRQVLLQRQRDNAVELNIALEGLLDIFAGFAGRPLATIDESRVGILEEAIKIGEAFAAAGDLAAKRAAVADMEKATSEEGLKLLKSEERELASLLDSLSTLKTLAIDLGQLDPPGKARTLAGKREAQEVLGRALVPAGATLEAVISLANAAAHLCSLDDVTGKPCPLCRREVGEAEVHLFRQYNDLLVGELEAEITALKTDLAKAEKLLDLIGKMDIAKWAESVTVPADLLPEVVRVGETLVANCNLAEGITPAALAALDEAASLDARGRLLLEGKTTAIKTATEGRDELLTKLVELKREIEPLAYAEAIQNSLPKIREARMLARRAAFFKKELSAFPGLLTKITNAAKKAHEELVVADFEARLNAEYQCLTEKDMAALGVTLTRKGTDASVTVLPQVGGKDIEGVLSEGEQRVHALALFFAELETCPQSVVVFDDPISSFDYNFIGNYCQRLRDFAQAHPQHQIVVLTHNWEFFVNLQTTLNRAKLTNDLSVQVLENCASLGEYSEDVTALKTEIEAILAQAGEPTRAHKELLAGNMRVLIEAVVNTHVFAKQRHQYKQKTQQVSNFDDYTKLVPLLPAEAVVLRDLYAKLSVSEHHDPRNAYVNTDKATFQARYDQVKAIELAIVGRK